MTRLTRRLFLTGVMIALSFISLNPAQASAGPPDKFIAGLGERVISIVTDDGADPKAREKTFREMFQSAFAVEDISRFVLGRHWRSATPEQRDAFVKAFEDFAVKTYSARFSQYSGEQFVVGQARPADDRGDQFVASVIERPAGGPPLRIDWRVRPVDGDWRIVDIMVEGVSMALTQRQEYTAVLQQNNGNVDTLVEKIRQRTASN